MKISTRLPIFLALLLGCWAATTNADTLRTVAITGDPAPGTGEVFSRFGTLGPALNNAGLTAFIGTLSRPGANHNNDFGIWSEGSGTLSLVAREGNGAPGTNTVFSNFGTPTLNDAGQSSFQGQLDGPGVDDSNEHGFWLEESGSLTLVAREGSAAPGTSAVFSRLLGASTLNNAGQMTFRGQLSGPGVNSSNNTGIWSKRSGSLALVARTGSIAPGTGANYSFFHNPILNDAGQIAFIGGLTGPGVSGSNGIGIWSKGSGSLALEVREGEEAPGTQAFFHRLSPIHLAFNGAGQIAFRGSLIGPGVDRHNNGGIWSAGNGSLALVARTGNIAPGTSARFSFLHYPALNDAGQIAFWGTLSGSGVDSGNGSGIWMGEKGSLSLVARAGESAPGTNAFFSMQNRRIPVLNGGGQVAFEGLLIGPGVDRNNNEGIWAQDPFGELTLIAREGDHLDVDDGPGTDLRTIDSLNFRKEHGGEFGRRSGFNDLGQLAFWASFTDGTSGIFVSNLVAVPEPSSLALLVLAGVAMLRCGGLRG